MVWKNHVARFYFIFFFSVTLFSAMRLMPINKLMVRSIHFLKALWLHQLLCALWKLQSIFMRPTWSDQLPLQRFKGKDDLGFYKIKISKQRVSKFSVFFEFSF